LKIFIAVTLLLALLMSEASSASQPADISRSDPAAIKVLLATYTRAVSTKDQSLIETLLLNKAIPFSYIPANGVPISDHGTEKYEVFRKGVFEGAAFTQRFEDVRILQHGGVADVTLVFVNTTTKSSTRGWKSMQLLKIDGSWKIASEFFTDFP